MRTRKTAPETSWPLIRDNVHRLILAFKNPMWNVYGSKYLVTHHFENCHDVIWNILVKAQCNTTTESNEFPQLCSYCWIPSNKNAAMLKIDNAPTAPINGEEYKSSYGGEYKLKKICNYSPPKRCNIWSLVKGTCTDCSWKYSSRLNKWAYQNLISIIKINMNYKNL